MISGSSADRIWPNVGFAKLSPSEDADPVVANGAARKLFVTLDRGMDRQVLVGPLHINSRQHSI
jgi:hypothetical protein